MKQTAEFLELHPETVRSLARSGEFPEAVMRERGAPILIPWSDVESYLGRNRPAAGEATTLEVAAALSLHEATVTAMVTAGAFPNAYRTASGRSSRTRIPWADVEDYRKTQPRVNR